MSTDETIAILVAMIRDHARNTGNTAILALSDEQIEVGLWGSLERDGIMLATPKQLPN